MSADRQLNMGDFLLDLMQGYRGTKAVLVAHDIGVFDALSQGLATPEEIGQRLNCSSRGIRLLLDALVELGLLEAGDGAYQNLPLAEHHLVSSSEAYIGDILVFQHILWDAWSRLENVVRTGKPHKPLAELLGDREPAFVESYIRGMQRLAAAPARQVAGVLADTTVSSILDVGGGPGRYCEALLDCCPEARATLLDLPETLGVAERLLAASPSRERITLRPGNYLTDDYGRDFDLVLMSHVTHDESATAVRSMAGRASSALRPGGRIAIHDWLSGDPNCRHPTFRSLFALNLAVYTSGRLYTEQEYETILAEAGFSDVRSHPILDGAVANPTRLIVGTKR
jgi:SAM-dependent methyltransferase